MDSSIQTSGSVRDRSGIGERVTYWVLLEGNRLVVATAIVAAVVLIVYSLIAVGVLAVGPSGYVASLFGSGITAGVVTLVTIALSINQLVLSRVFGSPNQLRDRLEGTQSLRQTVEQLAGESSSPNDPASFLSLVASTLSERAGDLLTAIEDSEWGAPDDVTAAVEDVVEYGEAIDENLEGEDDIIDVLDIVLGPEYAWNMIAIQHVKNEYADSLSTEVLASFQAVEELLETVAVARQFFKTLSLQQDLAHLSRVIVYSGLAALVVSLSVTLVYQSNAVTIPRSILPVFVSLGVGGVVAPLAAFVSYNLRSATIAHRTVSVGPFVSPTEQ